MAYDDVLLGLYAGDDVAQPFSGGRAQHRLQIRVL